MGQIGNTGFINTTTGGTDLISDTFVQLDDGTTNNVSDATAPVNALGQSDETAVIFDIKVPERNEVLDSNSKPIPENVTFSSMSFQYYKTAGPSGGANLHGYLLKDSVNLEKVTHETSDGATAWEPLGSTVTSGRTIYKSKIISGVATSSTGAGEIDFNNLKQNEITWGSQFQFILYSSVDMTIGTMNNTDDSGSGYPKRPDIKIFFDKPVPPAPKIEVIPDAGGINGIIKITPSTDEAVVKHRIDWNFPGMTASTNTTDFTDVGRTEILTSELVPENSMAVYPAAATGTPITYANDVAPLAFDSNSSADTTGDTDGDTQMSTSFILYAEDNYNTDTNGGVSNTVTIARPAITLTDSASSQINIGDENTFTLAATLGTSGAGMGNYNGQFLSYAFHPSVDDIVYDSGITLAGSMSADVNDESKDISTWSKPFETGTVIKINNEYMRVVGFDNATSNIMCVERAILGSSVASHSSSDPIYKVDDTQFLFTELANPTSLHTFTYKYPKAKSSHTAVAYVKDQDGWRSDPAHIAVDVADSNPIAKLSASRTVVPYAQYGDSVAGLTLSLSNSKAIGTDNEITNYLFAYKIPKGVDSSTEPQPIACANGLTNDNTCFDSGSKRVAIVDLGEYATGGGGNRDLSDCKFKIFGVASFYDSSGTETASSDAVGQDIYYKTVSETLTVSQYRLTEVASTNYYKSIDCIVGVDVSSNDDECHRFCLKVAKADYGLTKAAQINGSGLASDATVTTVTVDSPDTENYSVGDLVVCENELMLVTAITSATQMTVIRQMYWGGGTTHADDEEINIVNHPIIVNKELRLRGWDSESPDGVAGNQYWRWGGFARVIGVGGADGVGIDFATDETIRLRQTSADDTSDGSGNTTDWYANGFAEGDIIKVGNTTNNGTYTAPKYFKILQLASAARGGSTGSYSASKDYAILADSTDLLTDEEALYVSTSITAETDTDADIVRFDNALNPTRTVSLSNFNSSTDLYIGEANDFIFAGGVVDANTVGIDEDAEDAPWLYRDAYTTTKVRAVSPKTLDLDSLMSSGDISLLNTSISRSGGVSAEMPLGNRKYPIAGRNIKLGNVELTANIRIQSQSGLRKIWSLIEGDRYDFIFLDSKQVDAPTTAYKSYRMKLKSGSLSQSPDNASHYLANLRFAVVGEEID